MFQLNSIPCLDPGMAIQALEEEGINANFLRCRVNRVVRRVGREPDTAELLMTKTDFDTATTTKTVTSKTHVVDVELPTHVGTAAHNAATTSLSVPNMTIVDHRIVAADTGVPLVYVRLADLRWLMGRTAAPSPSTTDTYHGVEFGSAISPDHLTDVWNAFTTKFTDFSSWTFSNAFSALTALPLRPDSAAGLSVLDVFYEVAKNMRGYLANDFAATTFKIGNSNAFNSATLTNKLYNETYNDLGPATVKVRFPTQGYAYVKGQTSASDKPFAEYSVTGETGGIGEAVVTLPGPKAHYSDPEDATPANDTILDAIATDVGAYYALSRDPFTAYMFGIPSDVPDHSLHEIEMHNYGHRFQTRMSQFRDTPMGYEDRPRFSVSHSRFMIAKVHTSGITAFSDPNPGSGLVTPHFRHGVNGLTSLGFQMTVQNLEPVTADSGDWVKIEQDAFGDWWLVSVFNHTTQKLITDIQVDGSTFKLQYKSRNGYVSFNGAESGWTDFHTGIGTCP